MVARDRFYCTVHQLRLLLSLWKPTPAASAPAHLVTSAAIGGSRESLSRDVGHPSADNSRATHRETAASGRSAHHLADGQQWPGGRQPPLPHHSGLGMARSGPVHCGPYQVQSELAFPKLAKSQRARSIVKVVRWP